MPFIAVALSILAAGHFYVWKRLVQGLPWSPLPRAVLTYAIAGLGAGILLTLFLRWTRLRGFGGRFQTALFAWLGIGFLLIVGLLAADVARGLLAIAPGSLAALHGARLPELLTLGGAALGALASLAALRGALGPPGLREIRIALPGLPEGARGLTIVQLSDVHLGPLLGASFLDRIVDRVNALEPDIIAITGDLVDGPVERLGPVVEPLRRLRAKHGVFFVPGNHDHYSGLPGWLARLREVGVEVLQNRWTLLRVGQGEVVLAGVDD
ncbi:MAG: metallophosphoesterase, partial [Deltaproteobacteria bacterium]